MWIIVFNNDEFLDDLERELEDRDGGGSDGFETKLRLAAAVARVGLAPSRAPDTAPDPFVATAR